jgi:hypothetical protein
MIEPVIVTIMGGELDAPKILKYKKQLTFSLYKGWQPELSYALAIVLDYVAYRLTPPPDVETLKEFVAIVPQTEVGFTSGQREWYKTNSTEYKEALDALDELLESDFTPPPSTDWELIVAALLAASRRYLYSQVYQEGISITNGTYVSESKFAEPLNGIEDARRHMQQRLMKEDTCRDVAQVEGDLHEHLNLLRTTLNDALVDPDSARCYTGFPTIDKNVVIGPGLELGFVGIAGFLNHGKSGFLLTWLYHLLMQGKRVLFAPLEFSPMTAWQRLAWLHLEQNRTLNLPSLSFWYANPTLVTTAHVGNLNLLIDEVKHRLPGRIEVLHCSTWADVEEAANAAAIPYDVVCVDYLAHLQYEGREKMAGINNIFRKAQAFSHTYRDNRGVVVITPLQTNKAGLQRAADHEPLDPDYGVYDTASIEMYTDALRHLDLCISIFQDDFMRAYNEAKISKMKSRTNGFMLAIIRKRIFLDIGRGWVVTRQVPQFEPQIV